jgi:hypothetical protein
MSKLPFSLSVKENTFIFTKVTSLRRLQQMDDNRILKAVLTYRPEDLEIWST